MQGFRFKSPVLVGLHYSMLVSSAWMYLCAKFIVFWVWVDTAKVKKGRHGKGDMERKGAALVSSCPA